MQLHYWNMPICMSKPILVNVYMYVVYVVNVCAYIYVCVGYVVRVFFMKEVAPAWF